MELLLFLSLGVVCSCERSEGESTKTKDSSESSGKVVAEETGDAAETGAAEAAPKAVTLISESSDAVAEPAGVEEPVSPEPRRPVRELTDFSDWEVAQLEEHYWETITELEGPEIAEFEIDVLGAWCAEDVESCFSSLEENLEEEVAWQAKRNAATGWAERNWVGAYEWYQVNGGDVGGLAKLGGDASGMIETLFRKMAQEDLDGATEAVNYFLEEKHREIALRVLEEFPSR